MNEDVVIEKIVQIESDVKILKEKAKKLDFFDDLMVGQDRMIGILLTIQTEITSISSALKRHDEKIKELELA